MSGRLKLNYVKLAAD